MNRNSGFTLIELMVTLAVAVIIATIAVPNFKLLIQDNRTVTQTNALISALNLARSEAIKRGGNVSVCRTGTSYAAGFDVRVGADCGAGALIRRFDELRRMDVDTLNGANDPPPTVNVPRVTFDGRGARVVPAVNLSPLIFHVQPDDCQQGASNRARRISLLNTGRVSVERADCTND